MSFNGGKILITNTGRIASGDMEKGILDADAIAIEDGIITGIGRKENFSAGGMDHVIDANGLVVIPGLIDSHTHPYLEDWSPITKTVSWMESSLLAGTTTMLSATTFCSGQLLDADFLTHMACVAEQKYRASRPGGYLKLHAGTVILVPGYREEHFKTMADAGVHLFSEIGCMGEVDPEAISEMLDWGRKYNMKISAHFGGRTVTGSSSIPVDNILKINPDLVAHLNGGSTAASWEDTKRLIDSSSCHLELQTHGNAKMMHRIVDYLKEIGELQRLVLGSDTPVGIGCEPAVIIRLVVAISSQNELPAETVLAMATGNTADYVGANTGKIEVGREADLLIIDRPPDSMGRDALEAIEVGDTFGTDLVMVDGQIVTLRGRDTRPTDGNIFIDGVEQDFSDMSFDEWCFGKFSTIATHPW